MEFQLKRIRESKRISQKEMAQALSELMNKEIKLRTYGSWERREVTIDLEQAFYCCQALGCTLNDLVGMKSPSSPALTDSEAKLVDDYRATHDFFKPEVSDYAARQAERHPKKQADGGSGVAAGEAV